MKLTIISGFRGMKKQEELYDKWIKKIGNLAAKPGYSNHQNGIALDLNASQRGVFSWLAKNAATYGFCRTVPKENWHWEYRPKNKGPCINPYYVTK